MKNSPAVMAPLFVLAIALGPASAQKPTTGMKAQATPATAKAKEKMAKEKMAKTKVAKLLDVKLPAYKTVPGISGNLNSVGSDTLNNLMTLWAEGFRKMYPGVRIQIEGKGSSTAPPALISGTAQLGPMSRAMKSKEVDKFEKKYGYAPTRIKVAIDALAVYVHKDNPLEHLSLPEVDAIFSKTRKGGIKKPISSWGQAGLETDRFRDRAIRLYGRNSASGTYGYFKKVALFKGDYSDNVKEQPGSASVVRSVAEDLYGIGYSGIGYKTSGVKTLALSKKPGGPYFGTDANTVLKGKYPLSRFLNIYVNKAPNEPMDPMIREFLKYVLSREGQIIVIKDGYLPISHKLASKMLAELLSQ